MAKIISRETLTVGIFAVLAGLAAAYGVRSYLYRPEEVTAREEKPPAPRMLRVPLAGMDLPADRVITLGDIIHLSMTKEDFLKRFQGVDPDQVLVVDARIINRRLKEPIPRGQPFLTTKLYLEGTGPSITKKLRPGYRAIRVEVPDTREGGVQPGIFVDVFFRAQARAAKHGQSAIPERTITLLRNIEVLEANRPSKGAAKKSGALGARTKSVLVTLAVPEEKAELFSIIEGRGELWLVPTPAKEAAEEDTTALADVSTLEELLGIEPPRSPRSRPFHFETAIYRRGRLKINRFVDGKLVSSRTIYRGPRTLDDSTSSPAADSPATPQKEE